MVGYVVQMLNVDDRPIIEADAEPTVELVVNVGDCWVFKKGGKTVAQFRVGQVVAWWEYEGGPPPIQVRSG